MTSEMIDAVTSGLGVLAGIMAIIFVLVSLTVLILILKWGIYEFRDKSVQRKEIRKFQAQLKALREGKKTLEDIEYDYDIPFKKKREFPWEFYE